MSNIIPPMVSSSPPPLDDTIDDDDDDDFGDFASANLHYDIGGEDDEEEDYVEYGTALQPLDEDATVRKKPFSVEDQVAKDSQGRRRFHGAFTGGFSAGFFNTVGSLEGWTPSSFKSSRSERAVVKSQKTRDFMDDEDVSEFGISPSVLRATSNFSSDQKKRKREDIQFLDGPIPGKPVLKDLLERVRETVGVKLLRKMGWRRRQSIGIHLIQEGKRRANQEQKTIKGLVYGCALPCENIPGSESDSTGDEESYTHIMFAPEDHELLFKPRHNLFGIGYEGLNKRPILSRHVSRLRRLLEERKRSSAFSGQAFGVGALEDDDEDIYEQEDMTQYDFSLDQPVSSKQNPKSRLSSQSHVGKVWERFTRGYTISSNKRHFPPPQLPSGFQPIHKICKTRFQFDQKIKAPERQAFAASDRAAILSESVPQVSSQQDKKQLPYTVSEVIEQLRMSSEHANKLKLFASNPDKHKQFVKIGQGDEPENVWLSNTYEWEKFCTSAAVESKLKPVSDRFVAAVQPDPSNSLASEKEANKLKPLASNPDKHKQFVRIGQGDEPENLWPLNVYEWEKFRESAVVKSKLKPISDRFVAAVQPDDPSNLLAPVENLIDTNEDKKIAVKMKMFGRLTRETSVWQPCNLLCKRFNIVEPHISHLTTSASRKPSRFSVFDYLDASALNKTKVDCGLPTPSSSSSSSSNDEVKTDSVIDVEILETVQEDQREDNELFAPDNNLSFGDVPEKVDLYKAIFLSSSDESEIEAENEDEMEKHEELLLKSNTSINMGFLNPNPPVTTCSTSLPWGVFANLDLDAINVRKKLPQQSPTPGVEPDSYVMVENKEDVSVYGPKLPPSFFLQSPAIVNKIEPLPSTFLVPQGEWVEKPKIHKTKHHKKEKHKKFFKHKSKKNKKKK